MLAASAGDLERFEALLDEDPELAGARSGCSHPTLLQFVVVDGGLGNLPDAEALARALIDRGAPLDEPLVAAASVGARALVDQLLAAGAPLESCAPWTPLEESIYWARSALSAHLRDLGARVPSLRAAAGIGDLTLVGTFLTEAGPTAEAGPVRYPWGAPSDDPRDVIDQALIVAVKNDRRDVVRRLLAHGADPSSFPPGIHEGGSALHHAATRGLGEMASLLLAAGADPTAPDSKHRSTPAGWAAHSGHAELGRRLTRAAERGPAR